VNTLRPFDEFTRQRLLPHRLNGQGPALATADVNGDGIADLFVTGTAGQAGELYLGHKDGSFVPAPDQPWADAAEADDVGAAFVDVNGDGHPDLFISAGGVQHNRGDVELNDRLYLNDGHGKFTLAPTGSLPADGESTGVVVAGDLDGSGRAAIFVGGRVVPGQYPATPRSFLYRNVGGKLVDVTDEVAPGLREIGMVTAAVWADVDGDKKPDLIVATEWGPVSYFHNTGGKLENRTAAAGLAGITGWWCSLAVADVNGDGRPDLVAGNVGLNTKYHASATEPAVLYAGDLDGSGRTQLIEAQYDGGRLVPLRGRSKLAYAYPWLPKKFPTYRAFAAASLADIFGEDKLATATKLTATELASGVFLQRPDGTFKFAPLPRAAQIASVNAIIACDFDGDGRLDLLCVGNDFSPEPSTGRFDGGVGVLLRGDGHGVFSAVPAAESGLLVSGEARGAVVLAQPGAKLPTVAVSRCDGPLLLFTPQ
jgi:enediyne biosynthesis protein E4